MLWEQGRAEYVPVTDDDAVEAFTYLSRTEGIIPAIESAHAVAYGKKLAKRDVAGSDSGDYGIRAGR